MKAWSTALVAGSLFLSGCVHDYLYVPVDQGRRAAGVRYPIPPTTPRARRTSRRSASHIDADLGMSPRCCMRASRSRTAVAAVDPRRAPAGLSAPGARRRRCVFEQRRGAGPGTDPACSARVDLYFAMTPPLNEALNLSGFASTGISTRAGSRVGTYVVQRFGGHRRIL